jgi:urease accessory protein
MIESALYRLLTWSSPGYPTGAFSYSHGLEWAVEAGSVGNLRELVEYVAAVLSGGGGWVDAVLFAHVWRAAEQPQALDELSELAAAFRGSAETARESHQQGLAFLEVTRQAWPHPLVDRFAERRPGALVAHCAAVALSCAAHGIALAPALYSYLHALAANLVSAGTRLIPLGQTQAQIAIARLEPRVAETAEHALDARLEDLGTIVPQVELCSMLHETQYTRLFRS